jgi:hypothetical protein
MADEQVFEYAFFIEEVGGLEGPSDSQFGDVMGL